MNLLYKWIKQGVSLDKLDWILQRVYHHSDRIDKWPRKRFLTESRDKLTLLIGVWLVRVKVSGGSPMITSKVRNWQKKKKDKIKKTGRRQPLITTKYDIQGTRNLFTGRNNKIICHKMLVKFQKCLDWVGQLIWGQGESSEWKTHGRHCFWCWIRMRKHWLGEVEVYCWIWFVDKKWYEWRK